MSKPQPLIDYADSCNSCGCSQLRVRAAEGLDTHPAPFCPCQVDADPNTGEPL